MTFNDTMTAAAFALVTERCRHAYIHDLRGGLQALQSAIELLARSARNHENRETVEKAVAIAKRALASQERMLVEMIQRISSNNEPVAQINAGEFVADIIHFLRNDVLAKSVTLNLDAAQSLYIRTQPSKCRIFLLGLCATTVDGIAAGSSVDVKVTAADENIVFEICSAMEYGAPNYPDLWSDSDTRLPFSDLLVALSARWAKENGGRLERESRGQTRNALKIYCPRALFVTPLPAEATGAKVTES